MICMMFALCNILGMEAWAIGYPKPGHFMFYNFEHEITSVDVYTNVGEFRFDPDGTFVRRLIGGPRADIKQLTQEEDAKMEAIG